MKIYQQEILDGLENALSTSNTIAYCALAEKYNPNEQEKSVASEHLLKTQALNEANKNQIDLFYLRSILVSTGWNKNDDVFDPAELWKARNTPEDKPFNFMHDEKDIIGHITGNVAVDYEGNEINETTPEVPSEFNILTTSVIYTSWSDAEQRERMEKIVSEIEDGKWFVSMECLFPNFDYALIDDNGKTNVIPRTEASAFLTKHLRAYGGTGKYQNYQVGRLLRNLAFSGKGLVSKPANPRSIILEGNELFDESKAYALEINSIKEKDMSDELNQQITDLQKELAEAKAANDALKGEIAASTSAGYEETIKKLEASLEEQTAKVGELAEATMHGDKEMKKKEEEVKAMQEKVAKMEEELAAYKKKEAMMKRQAKLEEAGLASEEASATVADFEDADDATFAKVVALMKKTAKREEVKEEAEAEATVEAEAETVLEDEVDSSEASEEDLDAVEEPAEVAIAEAAGEDEEGSLRAVASDWLGSVLRSTPKENN
jgi:hypothetical protein